MQFLQQTAAINVLISFLFKWLIDPLSKVISMQ